MGLRDWRDVVDVDFPEARLDRASVNYSISLSGRFSIRDVRVAMGKVIAYEDYVTMRERSLSRPLP